MSNSSAQSTQSTSENSNDAQQNNNNNNNVLRNTLPTPLPPPHVVNRVTRTPTEAIVDFDGNIQTVRANEVTFTNRVCNGKALAFWVHVLSLMIALISGLVMMIVLNNVEAPSFSFWAGIFTFAIGAFIPSPNYKAMGSPSVA